MPTSSGFFEIAGELVFPTSAKLESWLGQDINPMAFSQLGVVYAHLGEVRGAVADAFKAKVHLFRHDRIVRIAAADLYEEMTDLEGRETQAAACAILLAAAFGAEGSVIFTGNDEADSFAVEVANKSFAVVPAAEADNRDEAYSRAMADLRRKYEDSGSY